LSFKTALGKKEKSSLNFSFRNLIASLSLTLEEAEGEEEEETEEESVTEELPTEELTEGVLAQENSKQPIRTKEKIFFFISTPFAVNDCYF